MKRKYRCIRCGDEVRPTSSGDFWVSVETDWEDCMSDEDDVEEMYHSGVLVTSEVPA